MRFMLRSTYHPNSPKNQLDPQEDTETVAVPHLACNSAAPKNQLDPQEDTETVVVVAQLQLYLHRPKNQLDPQEDTETRLDRPALARRRPPKTNSIRKRILKLDDRNDMIYGKFYPKNQLDPQEDTETHEQQREHQQAEGPKNQLDPQEDTETLDDAATNAVSQPPKNQLDPQEDTETSWPFGTAWRAAAPKTNSIRKRILKRGLTVLRP